MYSLPYNLDINNFEQFSLFAQINLNKIQQKKDAKSH